MPSRLNNDIVDTRLKDRTVFRIGEYKNNHTHLLFGCKQCNHTWLARPTKVLDSNTGCPRCGKHERINNDLLDDKLKKKAPSIRRISDVIHTYKMVKFECVKCGNLWEISPAEILYGTHKCQICNPPKTKKQNNVIVDNRLKGRNIVRLGDYVNSDTPLMFKCTTCDNTWSAIPNSVLNRNSGCPHCAGNFGITTEIDGIKFKSRLESRCYQVVKDFCRQHDLDFVLQKPYNIPGRFFKSDFYIPKFQLWIEVSTLHSEKYMDNMLVKRDWVKDHLSENFIFERNEKNLKNTLEEYEERDL